LSGLEPTDFARVRSAQDFEPGVAEIGFDGAGQHVGEEPVEPRDEGAETVQRTADHSVDPMQPSH
jgi:hypothetical protein